jgi:hypothetical protein
MPTIDPRTLQHGELGVLAAVTPDTNPTCHQIALEIGMASTTVSTHLGGLQREGFITDHNDVVAGLTNANCARDAYEFLKRTFRPGDKVELRALTTSNKYKTISGYYDDFRQMAKDAVKISEYPSVLGVYYTLNPVTQVPKGAKGKTDDIGYNYTRGKAWRTSGEADMADRRNILVDIDPERPSGTASTDVETLAAVEVANTVQIWLTGQGWPEPTRVRSGNGIHLLYACAPGIACSHPMNNEGIRNVLRTLASMFNAKAAHVDTGVYNGSRISRLPGCLNRKGDNSTERPFRRAFVESFPVVRGFVTGRMINEIANMAPPDPRTTRNYGGEMPETDMEDADVLAYIDDFSDYLILDSIRKGEDGRTFFNLQECPFKGEAHSKATCALILGKSFGFHCFHDDHADLKMGDLKRYLFDRTGRWPEQPLWARGGSNWEPLTDDDVVQMKAWGICLEEPLDIVAPLLPVRVTTNPLMHELDEMDLAYIAEHPIAEPVAGPVEEYTPEERAALLSMPRTERMALIDLPAELFWPTIAARVALLAAPLAVADEGPKRMMTADELAIAASWGSDLLSWDTEALKTRLATELAAAQAAAPVAVAAPAPVVEPEPGLDDPILCAEELRSLLPIPYTAEPNPLIQENQDPCLLLPHTKVAVSAHQSASVR